MTSLNRQIEPAPQSSPIISGVNYEVAPTHGWRPRGTVDWLMISTIGGRGFVETPDGRRDLVRGDIMLIAPNTPQEYGHPEDDSIWINYWVHFRPREHWFPWLVWPSVTRNVMLLSAGDRIAEVEPELRRMFEVAQGPSALKLDSAMNSLERILIWADGFHPRNPASSFDPRIRRALEIIGKKFAEKISVADLAKSVGLSRSRFVCLFTEQVTLPPQSYIETVRLSRAAQLLQNTTWAVEAISDEVGFSSAYYFSTRFKNFYGSSPRKYREQKSAWRET